MTGRLDDLLEPLMQAVADADYVPARGIGEESTQALRDALAAALRAAVRPSVAPDRLDDTKLTGDAAALMARAECDPNPKVALLATLTRLLQQVREANQREEWIRAGYSADTKRAHARAEAAEAEAAQLAHAVRLVKRATRDIRVGRE